MSEVIDTETLKSVDSRPTRAPVQRRGQLRVDAILDAAEAVFGDVGVEAGSMNAIAERAGASVGSLYHFFPNKAAVLEALAERYGATMRATLARERRIDEPWTPLEVLFPQMIQAFMAMDAQHPGYLAVCRATDSASGGKSPVSLQTEEHMQALVRELLHHRCPGIPDAEAAVHASLSVVVVHSVLDQVSSSPEATRPAMIAALVELLVRYFTPVEARYPRPAQG